MQLAAVENDGTRAVPGQIRTQAKFANQTDRMAVRAEEVVIELFEPRSFDGPGLEATGEPARGGRTLEYGYVITPLCEAPRSCQPQGPATQNGHTSNRHCMPPVAGIFTARMLASRGWRAA